MCNNSCKKRYLKNIFHDSTNLPTEIIDIIINYDDEVVFGKIINKYVPIEQLDKKYINSFYYRGIKNMCFDIDWLFSNIVIISDKEYIYMISCEINSYKYINSYKFDSIFKFNVSTYINNLINDMCNKNNNKYVCKDCSIELFNLFSKYLKKSLLFHY